MKENRKEDSSKSLKQKVKKRLNTQNRKKKWQIDSWIFLN